LNTIKIYQIKKLKHEHQTKYHHHCKVS